MQDNMKQIFPAFSTYDLATATPLRHNPKSLHVCFHSLKRIPGLGCAWTSHSIVFHLHMLRVPVSRVVTSLTSVTNPCFSRTFIFPHIDIKSYCQATSDSMWDRYQCTSGIDLHVYHIFFDETWDFLFFSELGYMF